MRVESPIDLDLIASLQKLNHQSTSYAGLAMVLVRLLQGRSMSLTECDRSGTDRQEYRGVPYSNRC